MFYDFYSNYATYTLPELFLGSNCFSSCVLDFSFDNLCFTFFEFLLC